MVFHSYSKNYKQLNNSILEIEKQINKININDLENKLILSIDNEIEKNLIINRNKFFGQIK